jgi:hypothetical protein
LIALKQNGRRSKRAAHDEWQFDASGHRLRQGRVVQRRKAEAPLPQLPDCTQTFEYLNGLARQALLIFEQLCPLNVVQWFDIAAILAISATIERRLL